MLSVRNGKTQRHDFPSELEWNSWTQNMTFTRKSPTHAHVYVHNNEIIMIRQYEHNEQEINSFARTSFLIYINSAKNPYNSTYFNIFDYIYFHLRYNQIRAHNTSTRTSWNSFKHLTHEAHKIVHMSFRENYKFSLKNYPNDVKKS